MNPENPWLKALCLSVGFHLLLAAFFLFLERPKKPTYQVVRLRLKSVAYPVRKGNKTPKNKAKATTKSKPLKKRKPLRPKHQKTPVKKAKKTQKKLLAKKKVPLKSAHKTRKKAQKTRHKAQGKAQKRLAARRDSQKKRVKNRDLEVNEDLLAKRLAALKAQVEEEKKLEERLARLKEKASASPGGLSLGGGISQELATRLMAHLKSFWAVPEVLEDRKDLSAEVELKIAPDGHLISFRFLRRSGEPLFDEAVVATLKRADPLPAPGRSLTLPAVFRIY